MRRRPRYSNQPRNPFSLLGLKAKLSRTIASLPSAHVRATFVPHNFPMASTFKYAPLNRQSNQIRLIELHPGSFGESIQCTVHVQSLDCHPEYEALSYAWGESGRETQIKLDGHPFLVSTSLLSALQNIRHQDNSRILWVDALSIDQHNNREKEWQVSIMGTIFKNCSNGLLWVGEESEPGDAWCPTKNQYDSNHCTGALASDGACSYNSDQQNEAQPSFGKHKPVRKDSNRRRSFSFGSQGLAKCKHLNCRWHGKPPNISASLNLMESLQKDEHLYDIPTLSHTLLPREKLEYGIMEPLIALGALMSRSWWTRMWTVQEAALPPVSTLCWGKYTYPLENMAKSAERLFFHSQNCCSAFFASLIQRLDKLSCDEATVNALFNFQKHVHTLELTRRWVQKPEVNINLMDCLYNFHNRRSKHPRDKIFACLGLSPSMFGLKADYAINEQQWYKETSLHLLRSCPDRSLSVLWRESEPNDLLPSWVKEFDKETTALNRRARSEHYNASNGGTIHLVDCTNGVLSFLGTKVDVLSDVTQSTHSASTYSGYQFSAFREWAQFLKTNECRLNYGDGVTWLDVFAKTLGGDVDRLRPDHSGLNEEKLQDFVQSLTKKKPNKDLIESSLAQELNTSAADRKLFTTKEGRIGLGPRWMQPGDEVWILSGGSVPFILRPLSSQNSEENGVKQPSSQKHHVVIGDCYVQGIMFGEAVSATTHYQHVFLK